MIVYAEIASSWEQRLPVGPHCVEPGLHASPDCRLKSCFTRPTDLVDVQGYRRDCHQRGADKEAD
jgi:hypothetical protein